MASSEVAHGARRRKGRKLDAVLFLTASGLVGGKAGVLGRALRPAGCQGCRPTYAGQLPTHPSDPIPQIPSQLGWGGIGWADTDGGGNGAMVWGHSPTYRHQSPNHPSQIRLCHPIRHKIHPIRHKIHVSPYRSRGEVWGGWIGMDGGAIHSHMPKGMGTEWDRGGIRDLGGKGMDVGGER